MKKLVFIAITLLLVSSCSKKEIPQDQLVRVNTPYGEIAMVLYDDTPLHKENFLKLASEGFYDSTTFHRVMPGFMIQGGDPNSKDEDPLNDGLGGPGYTIDAEISEKYIHKKGALAAARMGDDQNPEKKSGGSQFFIVQGRKVQDAELERVMARINNEQKKVKIRAYLDDEAQKDLVAQLRYYNQRQMTDSLRALLMEVESRALINFEEWEYTPEQRSAYQNRGGYPSLDMNYTIFGEVVQGLSVIDSIAVQERDRANRPNTDIHMTIDVDTLSREEISRLYGYSYE